MFSENRKNPAKPRGASEKAWAGFCDLARKGATDIELARAYGLTERTATNWRIRAVGSRKTPKENPPGDSATA